MKIYKISRLPEQFPSYDTYDSAIVYAENEEKAKCIHPSKFVTHFKEDGWYGTSVTGKEYKEGLDDWIEWKDRESLVVEYLGRARSEAKEGVILGSYNAG